MHLGYRSTTYAAGEDERRHQHYNYNFFANIFSARPWINLTNQIVQSKQRTRKLHSVGKSPLRIFINSQLNFRAIQIISDTLEKRVKRGRPVSAKCK